MTEQGKDAMGKATKGKNNKFGISELFYRKGKEVELKRRRPAHPVDLIRRY